MLLSSFAGLAAQDAPTGPDTEKRFPPLQLPSQFKATLFACDPLIEYPSVLSLGPRPNTIFLAHDYMTGLGEKIVRRDEVRLVEDTNGDGYADKSTVWATNFNSIQGLAYDNGRVFVMHSPWLTVLRDTNADGVADERKDLLSGLGWPPEKSTDRLHGANGVAVGHDGWLYLALGDRGSDVTRPEGDRLIFNGGGILRCRPDGTDLHVFSTGLRNIYDIALDEELNVFVRDNENDGGNYLIRVCHSFMGADHGYPYLYTEHPAEALAPLAELGRGSSAGGTVYGETAFPDSYQGGLFFCEWGKSVVFYPRTAQGAGFGRVKETEFATGGPNDPYGFRPTDIIVDRDGSLLVSDWADGQRPKRGRGRVYRIRHQDGQTNLVPGLNSPSYLARVEAQTELEQGGRARIVSLDLEHLNTLGRLHAVWLIAQVKDRERLFHIAATDPDRSVRVQAVRAIADLSDPLLVEHRLAAGRGDPAIARRLTGLCRDAEPRLLLEVTLALGRLRWMDAPQWLRTNLQNADATLQHAASQTLRRVGNWPAALEWLEPAADSALRSVALHALSGQAEPAIVDGLIHHLNTSPDPDRRREYVGLLARIHRKPGPWTYWGFRPALRPPNPLSWEKSAAIESALDKLLVDPNRDLRLAVLQQMDREKIPTQTQTLVRWLREEKKSDAVAAILSALREADPGAVSEPVGAVLSDPTHAWTNRLTALAILIRRRDASLDKRLVEIANSRDGTPGLVRVAAIEALAGSKTPWNATELQALLIGLLSDPKASVRAAAALAIGQRQLQPGAEQLLVCAQDVDPLVRRRSLDALKALREPRALTPAMQALERDDQELFVALKCLAVIGGPAQADAVAGSAMHTRSTEILQLAAQLLSKWDRAPDLARIAGNSGIMLGWRIGGPFSKEKAANLLAAVAPRETAVPNDWSAATATNLDSRIMLGTGPKEAIWIGSTEFIVPAASRGEFRMSANGVFDAWLNGRPVHHRSQPGQYATDSDRFDVELEAGVNRLVIQVSATDSPEMHARFRRKSVAERHERLAQLALTTRGNNAHGRDIFFKAEKTACITCHRLDNQGGAIGPDLTGIGRRFARIHLIESILEPSRAIAPAFRNLSVRLRDGQELTGVRMTENDSVLTLGDAQGQSHVLRKEQIEEVRPLELSIMPEGLENALTDAEFVDLIAFLSEQK